MALQSVLLLTIAVSGVLSQFTQMPASTNAVIEGETAVYRCAFTNATTIAWLREGLAIQSNVDFVISDGPGYSNLTFPSADRTVHNTTFSCVATTEDNNTETVDFEVQVYYIDDNFTVTYKLDCGDTVYVGSTIFFECRAPDAFPPARVSWFLNEAKVRDHEIDNVMFNNSRQNLTVTSIQVSQGGEWMCRATNDNITVDSQPQLILIRTIMGRTATIVDPQQLDTELGSQQLVRLNGFASLRCVFDPPLLTKEDQESVFWTVDGSGITHGSNGYDVTGLSCDYLLSVDNVMPVHAATYRCHLPARGGRPAIVSNSVEFVIATLRQTYDLSISPSSPIGEGREVTFTCTPEGMAGNVMETLSWQLLHTSTFMRISDGGRYSIDNSGQRLVVRDLRVSDSGIWRCEAAHNLTESVVRSIELVVEAQPDVTVSPASTVVRVGTSLSLNCTVDSQRDISFAWIVGGMRYTDSTDQLTITNTPSTSTLILNAVEEAALGNVTCEAQDPIHNPIRVNSVLTEDSGFYIYGDSDTRGFTIEEGSQFRLACGVRGGGPDTEVLWFRGQIELVDGVGGFEVQTLPNKTSLLLRDGAALIDDGDAYMCKAVSNGISLTQRFNVFITIPAEIVQSPPPITNATLGQRFQLDCVVGGRPRPQITWRFQGRPVNDLNQSAVTDLGNGTVVFTEVMMSHAGVYVCSVETTVLFASTTLNVVSGPRIILSQEDVILITLGVIAAVIICTLAVVMGIYCSVKHHRRSKMTGHYEVRHESPQVPFARQPSLRDRKDNSGILSSSPSGDIFDSLHKSPETSNTYKYTGGNEYSINPASMQMDMYSGLGASSTALSEKYPPTSLNSTPLHGTMASTSLFSSEDPAGTSAAGHLPNFPRTNLELGDVMGEGEFGPVVLGVANHIISTQEKTLVAVKVLVSRGEDDDLRPDMVLMDFANQMKLTYSNIASILGICSDVEPYYVIYEYLDQGDLKKFLHRSEPEEGDPPTLTPADMSKIILQVADGMAYLFSQRIIHGDLATRNCLISSTLEVKIADLGIGHDLYNQDYYDNGSQLLPIRWMPPELLQQMEEGPNFSLASDVWSFGVLCWEVFAYARLPFENFEDNEILSIVPAGSRLRKPSPVCPHALYELMSQCWNEQPDRRPQFARLCVAIVDLDFDRDQFSQ